MNPTWACAGYLSGIFTGVLANGKRWTATWAPQIIYPLARMQCAVLLGYVGLQEGTCWAQYAPGNAQSIRGKSP